MVSPVEGKAASKPSVHQSQTKTPSTAELQFCSKLAVYCHLKETGHVYNSRGVEILDKERDWRRRGIKEAILERVEDPTLSKKEGLGFSLSHTWDRALSSFPRSLSHDSELTRDQLH